MRVPAIPFPPQEVFLPGETKKLHLFEARYLSLFEHVVINCDKQCAHVLVAMERKAMAAYGTVVRVREWRRLNVSVSVSFEAVGRLRMTRLHQASPFLQADVQVVHDEQLKDQAKLARVASLEEAFWPLFRDVVALCIQLGEDPLRNKIDTSAETIAAVEGEKASRDEMEDVRGISKDSRVKHYEEALLAAAKRAVNEEEVRFFIVTNSLEMLSRRATALSFAAWDFFASTPGERQKALEQKDMEKRLEAVVEQLELRKKKLAAKIALQNAFSE